MAESSETGRLEAFSDGVFAIAITLLILEIKVPPVESVHSSKDLWERLFQMWPSYFAFVYSFGSILVMWLNHHQIFKLVNKSSPRFMYVNGFLLLTVTLIPFPTALLAEYILTPYRTPAVVFFCFSGGLNSLAFVLLSNTMLKPIPLVHENVEPRLLIDSARRTRFGLLIYTSTTVLAMWLPIIALLINSSLWILWIALSIRNFAPAKKAPRKVRKMEKVH